MFKPGITITVPFGPEQDWRFDTEPQEATPESRERFTSAVVREILTRARDFRREIFVTVYFGGPGPSNLTLDQIYRILQALYDNLTIQPEEQTLVVLPGTLDRHRAKVLQESSFDYLTLRVFRPISPAAVSKELNTLRDAGFSSVGLEIPILENADEIESLCRLQPDHITFIPSPRGNKNTLPAPELNKLLADYQEYLPGHFARAGKENHHLIALSGTGTIAGFGPGAFSRKTGKTIFNPPFFHKYLKVV